METHPASAVFLSYASQDIDAARRIADALRAFGVEVWFDQNELRGGDAWDRKIHQQIHECTLFLAVISATTEERGEGYFRREWHLAVDRTRDLADGVPFIIPVAIDDLAETEAAVPEEFRRVQWTRLPHGVPTPQFIEQVKRLLEAPRKPAHGMAARTSVSSANIPSGSRRRGVAFSLLGAAAIGVVGLAIWLASRPAPPAPVAAKTIEKAVPVGAQHGPKSIAVLPFDNISEDKQANAHFADGMHEDILTNLALIRELHVTSHTSVLQYRDSKKPIREIGKELGVAYVLEGSVRRDAKRVRITAQLIRADTDAHLWAEKYDKELTDMFSIQSEIATVIAEKLKAVMLPQEKKLIERRPTADPVAYDLYLKARALRQAGPGNRDQRISALEDAVKRDPNFAAAWAFLSEVTASEARYSYVPDVKERWLKKSRDALAQATQLASDAPETLLAQGRFAMWIENDYPKAIRRFEAVLSQAPNESVTFGSLANIARRQGRWSEALMYIRRAVALDPKHVLSRISLVRTLAAGRRYEDEAKETQELLEFSPPKLADRFNAAFIWFHAAGSTREVEQLFASLSESDRKSAEALSLTRRWAFVSGDLDGFMQLAQAKPAASPYMLAPVLAARGDIVAVRALLSEELKAAEANLEKQPANPYSWRLVARYHAVLGQKVEALRCARKAIELLPESSDRWDGPYVAAVLPFVYAWTGDKDRAIDEYARLLRVPSSGLNVHEMKRSPAYAPLRDDPRFQALLADPKNNAPLF